MALSPLVQDYYIREDESDDEEDEDKFGDSHESDDEDGCPAGNRMSFDEEMELERKSRLPQPDVPLCSESLSADESKSRIKSDDGREELFYDPEADEADEKWIEDKRDEYLRTKSGAATSSSKLTGSRIKKTDAVLNCPGCMILLCLSCQRHETYKTQYRAMFVENCTTDFGQELRVPQSGDGHAANKKHNKRMRSKKKKNEDDDDKGSSEFRVSEESTGSNNKTYYAVKCSVCSTQVAVHDQDDVYHFFNVLASHS